MIVALVLIYNKIKSKDFSVSNFFNYEFLCSTLERELEGLSLFSLSPTNRPHSLDQHTTKISKPVT
jgi:hypothetical protein